MHALTDHEGVFQSPRTGHYLFLLSSGYIAMVGGENMARRKWGGSGKERSLEVYDLTCDVWQTWVGNGSDTG